MIDPTFWAGLGVGLAVSAGGGLGLWWVFGRRRHAHGPVPEPVPVVPDEPFGSPTIRVPETVPPGPWVADVARIELFDPSGPVPSEPAGLPWSDPRTSSEWEQGLKTSQRLLLHVARQGSAGPSEVAPRTLCQAGMVEALGVSQGALTGVLRRLVAAGVLGVSREHVRGIDRRVQVYRLTPAGTQLAREVRARRPAGAASPGEAATSARRESRLPRVQIVPPPDAIPVRRG
jgi:DNA-binding MarR family transcriptional regulator